MIVTLTLNPAIDTTIYLSGLAKNQVNHILEKTSHVGGKGINVTTTLAAFGQTSHAIVFTAGPNGQKVTGHLNQLGVSSQAFSGIGDTRENIKLILEKTHDLYELNERGPTFEPTVMTELTDHLDAILKVGDVLVLSGSLPQGIEDTVYHTLIKRYHPQGVSTILDASKTPLTLGIAANPSMIKPNHHELADYFSTPFDHAHVADWVQTLYQQGIAKVFVTCGKDGAYAFDGKLLHFAPGLMLKPLSTVGAGDAFVAGVALYHDSPIKHQLKWGVAFASAATQTLGTQPPEESTVQQMLKNITIESKELT